MTAILRRLGRLFAFVFAVVAAIAAGGLISLVLTVEIQRAFALPSVEVKNEARYTRIPILDQGHEVAVGTSSAPVLNDTGSYSNESDLWLFEWGTSVSIECVARACFCMALDDDSITIGSGTTCGDVADTGTPGDTTGGNACVTVPAGGRVDFIVSREHWGWVPPYSTATTPVSQYGAVSSTDPAGYRSGYCAAADTTSLYPCDAADDCRNAANDGNGTCTDSATSFSNIAGAFLISEAAVATSCSVRKDL